MVGSVPELPGVKAEPALAHAYQKEVANLLGRRQLQFPGAQPVSFASHHLAELEREDYYVCEKSDGLRCLLYFAEGDGGSEIHYLIDRKNDYYFVPGLHFPHPDDPSFLRFHTSTLVDGELVYDTLPSGARKLKYLVFDCLLLDGQLLTPRTLDKRIAYFRDKVYKPYKHLYATFPDEVAFLPFELEFKRLEFSYAVQMLFRDVLPNLPHGNDGLIFTCRAAPYRSGTDEKILKWKPAHENSVDFRLNLDFPPLPSSPSDSDAEDDDDEPRPDYDAMPTFHLSAAQSGGTCARYAQMYLTAEEWAALKARGEGLEDAVVECFMDAAGRWRFSRFRKDKDGPNHISTVESVVRSIRDGVEEAQLVRAAKTWRERWKARLAAGM
ncbi:MAG: Dcp1p-Dcp2p decapping enzyme complex alpha subunit [Trizodia sp. TS-e1964]|nr:MAG: Dcp1p-Dcp2p decapping enzyme complex alpha subunit [Trizodia sp. TS-e1964]